MLNILDVEKNILRRRNSMVNYHKCGRYEDNNPKNKSVTIMTIII
jgi:hypothetical protein